MIMETNRQNNRLLYWDYAPLVQLLKTHQLKFLYRVYTLRKMAKVPGNLVLGGTIICLLLVAFLYSVSSSDAFESWKIRLPNWRDTDHGEHGHEGVTEEEPLKFLLRRLVRGEDRVQLETTGFACHSDLHTEVCLASKPVGIGNRGLEIYVPSSQAEGNRTIQPYARKEDQTAMERVAPLQIQHIDINATPTCQYMHDVPAVIFSSGGFTGNIFHEINEVIIPLFLTCRHFQSHLQFVITDYKPWWVNKYKKILLHLSRYEVINPAIDGYVHCFPGAVIGLHYHDNLAINSTDIPTGYSMLDFKHFLRKSYNLRFKHVSEMEKPVLVFVSRHESRRFLNEDDMVILMEELGFQVITTTPSRMENLDKFTEVLNSCSVMVGAHGAGLANEVFLPDGAVLVQVVPLGLEWASTNYYGNPSNKMGVKYLEYKIQLEESTLLDRYGRDHPVIADPMSIFLQGYRAARAVYIDEQNIKINVSRFKETLIEATKLAELTTPFS